MHRLAKIGLVICALTSLALWAADEASTSAKSKEAGKKGWCGGHPDTAKEMNCSWFYNWGPHGESKEGLEFVPMIKSKHGATAKVLEAVKKSGAKNLLGFNEPERENQGNTTVEEALDIWPRLMDTGIRLGSPAPSSNKAGMEWLEKFMEGAEKRKLRVDFIAVHFYKSANAEVFSRWLEELHHRYNRPIWVTEFNAKFTDGDRDKFAKDAFHLLAHHKDVERYAYMNGFNSEPGALFEGKGEEKKMSKLGEVYRDVGR